MTEQELMKLIHANDQIAAYIQDWWDTSDLNTKGLLYQMMTEQRNLNNHLGNHLQVMILILAQMKASEMFQESERRKIDG